MSELELQELLQQRQMLDAKIDEARNAKKTEAIATCRRLIADFDLSEKDLFSGRVKNPGTGSKVAPKYRNSATGETWTGRGKPPKWIQGRNRDEFLIR